MVSFSGDVHFVICCTMKISKGIEAVECREDIPESSDDSVPMFRESYLVSIGSNCNTGTNNPPLTFGVGMLVEQYSDILHSPPEKSHCWPPQK